MLLSAKMEIDNRTSLSVSRRVRHEIVKTQCSELNKSYESRRLRRLSLKRSQGGI